MLTSAVTAAVVGAWRLGARHTMITKFAGAEGRPNGVNIALPMATTSLGALLFTAIASKTGFAHALSSTIRSKALPVAGAKRGAIGVRTGDLASVSGESRVTFARGNTMCIMLALAVLAAAAWAHWGRAVSSRKSSIARAHAWAVALGR